MLRQISPRLRRIDVVLNSFSGCISDAPEEFSRAPKMSLTEISPQPRMLAQKFKGRASLKQLKCFADTHCRRQLNKKMHMVNSDVKLVNFTSILNSSFMDEPFAVNSDSIKLERIHRIFTFPHKVEGILPEGMFKTLQIHFFPPCLGEDEKAHAKQIFSFHRGPTSGPLDVQELQEDKFMEGRIPPMFKSMGILRQM